MAFRRSYTLGLRYITPAAAIITAGGTPGSVKSTEPLSTCETYTNCSSDSFDVSDMLQHRRGAASCVIGKKLYVLGGFNGSEYLADSEVYDLELNQWKAIKSMNVKRSCAVASPMKHLIFVMGGWNGYDILKTVEIYNTETNTWSGFDDLLIARKNASCVSKEGCLYILGGWDGNTTLRHVEMLDTNDLSLGWTSGPAMIRPRECGTAVELKGDIYAFGGFSIDEGIFEYCEILKNGDSKWIDLPSMNIARECIDSVVVEEDDCIFVFGGWNGFESLESVEQLQIHRDGNGNPVKFNWSPARSLKTPRNRLIAEIIK